MATLLLTAAGTLLGGPIGGAIGALAGRTIDGAIIGEGRREGPRLKELTISTSSYGTPLPRQHGRMRSGGTIIWATELSEHRETSGGKKGQPSATTYSYSSSFAVALSSRPIRGIGRIWADGNLLRGEAGDLKSPGILRVHCGHGDQLPDPLIAADRGAACPAFRGCAYAVFEDLALGDFGNRIPALSFEILADDGPVALDDLLAPAAIVSAAPLLLAPLAGFANEGGPLAATVETIAALFPLSVHAAGAGVTIDPLAAPATALPVLPPAARAWDGDDFAPGEGCRTNRDAAGPRQPRTVRYYDIARDYQPGVQRAGGRAGAGAEDTIEFPGALSANDARTLVEGATRRAAHRSDRLQWRMAELDPALGPGTDVRVPEVGGVWRIESWEWRERGVELELVRRSPGALRPQPADSGSYLPPADTVAGPTILRAFEIPPASTAADAPTLFAAATAEGTWNGAALYADRDGALVPIGAAGRERATIGRLTGPLPPSPALLFDPLASLELTLLGSGGHFINATLAALAGGTNRLLVGEEIVQFALASPLGDGRWRLEGLLRGRGGTEAAALAGHDPGTDAVLLDAALTPFDRGQVARAPGTAIAAIGRGDSEPVLASLIGHDAGIRPPCPVHTSAGINEDGGLDLRWIRRARGSWTWDDGVEVPLVEEAELFRVGLGPADAPVAEWAVAVPKLRIDAASLALLRAQYPGEALWVRQVGRFAQSDPTPLGPIDLQQETLV